MSIEDSLFQTKKTLNLSGNLVSLDTPGVMGILNVTPDSFYQGSRIQQEKELLKKAEEMLSSGALILDVGGYSSRPGADEIPIEVELSRVVGPIKLILKEYPEANVSIDSFRAEVARAALDAGACMINDISGGTLDEGMLDLVVERNIPYVLMHMKGSPQNMRELTDYTNLLKDIARFFAEQCHLLHERGVKDIIIDPGFGFAKTIDQNYELLRNLGYFKSLRVPILAGISRKSMIYKKLDTTPDKALNGTTALHMIALLNGASILRVHDVKEAVEAVKLFKLTYP